MRTEQTTEQTTEKRELPTGFYKATFMIGLGFFTMGLMDPLYDNYVPVFLNGFVASRALIGALMTIDNIMALLLIPIVTAVSDNARTPIGRRMPFVQLLLPLSAITFALFAVRRHRNARHVCPCGGGVQPV